MGKTKRLPIATTSQEPPWTPFEEHRETTEVLPDGSRVERTLPPGYHSTLHVNSRYSVWRRKIPARGPYPDGVWLSIKRIDKKAIRTWRHLQRIKNELVGPEAEAVELFPAESRKVDGANQYHLFCFPNYRFDFGFDRRLVKTEQESRNEVGIAVHQDPFEPDDPWNESTPELVDPLDRLRIGQGLR